MSIKEHALLFIFNKKDRDLYTKTVADVLAIYEVIFQLIKNTM